MAGELNGILKYVRRRAGSGAEIDGIGRWYGGKPVFFAMCVIPTGRVKEMCVQWKKKVRERVETPCGSPLGWIFRSLRNWRHLDRSLFPSHGESQTMDNDLRSGGLYAPLG